MRRCVLDCGALQASFSEAETELKTSQQLRQKDVWQLLHRWSLKVCFSCRRRRDEPVRRCPYREGARGADALKR